MSKTKTKRRNSDPLEYVKREFRRNCSRKFNEDEVLVIKIMTTTPKMNLKIELVEMQL